jgi:hypothetical protein
VERIQHASDHPLVIAAQATHGADLERNTVQPGRAVRMTLGSVILTTAHSVQSQAPPPHPRLQSA